MTREDRGAGEVVLVKLGGSLITDKSTPDTARHDVIARLAEEIAEVLEEARSADRNTGPAAPHAGRPSPPRRLVLGHGSGSFGHAAALRYRVHEGVRRSDPEARRTLLAGVSETQERAAALHRLVLGALRNAGLAPFSVAPSSAVVAAGGRPVAFAAEPVALALDSGLLPVVFGDVVMDREQGWAICSTESALAALERALAARGIGIHSALWAGATPGVLDAAGSPIPWLTPATAAQALAAAGGAAGTDVTGGMLHRLEATLELARRGTPSLIFDGREPGALARVLAAALDAMRGEGAAGSTAASEIRGTRVLPDSTDR